MAIAALTAACFLPAAASAADLRPCAGGARCGSVTVPLVAADPAAGSVNVGFEVYAHKRAGKARDTILVSAGSDGVPTTAGRAALLALLDPLRDRRDVVLVDARGTGRSGRVGPRRDAYGAGASAGDLDAVRAALGIGHVELYGAGDGARIALAYAARHGDRLRALVLDGGPRATLFSGDGHGETHALARALGHGETAVAELAARLRTHPLHAHGRIDDDVLARVAANGDAAALGDLPAASTAALRGDPLPLARLVGRHGACRCAPGRPRRRRAPATTTPRPPRARRWKAGRSPGRPGGACSGSPPARAGRSRPRPTPCCRPARPSRAPALVLAGEVDVRAPTATLRKVASLFPQGRYVRVRGAGALPALSDPAGCAATLARAFLKTRGHVSPSCASRRTQPLRQRPCARSHRCSRRGRTSASAAPAHCRLSAIRPAARPRSRAHS